MDDELSYHTDSGEDSGDSNAPVDVADASSSIRRRGTTGMHEITRVSSEGHRRVIKYNEDGQPIGFNATKLASFIGTCARHHVPITIHNWKAVPFETKEKIYDLVQGGFVVDPRSKKHILQSVGKSFRQFKHKLTTKYILPFKDFPEILKSPPMLYSYIEEEQWDTFVKSRLTNNFEVVRNKKQEVRQKNLYNHRLSRKGYAKLVEEIKESSPNETRVERCVAWKRARMNHDGKIADDLTREVVERIDALLDKKKNNGGNASTPTRDDILSQALGTKEAHGSVRGVGKFVTPTQYFHTPRPDSNTKAAEHEGANEREKVMRARIKELEEELLKQKKSGQKSTSMDSALKDVKEETVELGEEKIEVDDISTEEESIKKRKLTLHTIKVGTPCRLAMGSISSVVASGTIFESDLEGDNMKVAIDVVVDGGCSIPLPSKKGANLLSQEIGSHLLWPRHLVIPDNEKDTELVSKKSKKSKVVDLSAMNITQSSPVSLRCLLRTLKHVGSAIQINTPTDVFGMQRKSHIMVEVIEEVCNMRAISTACLDAYMMYLYKFIERTRTCSKYKFLDAGSLSISTYKEERATLLTARLLGMDPNQLLIFPYNSGNHWVLIIVDHSNDSVFYIDSLKNRLHNDITEVVGKAFKVMKKIQPKWHILKCPKQPGSVECGYYVMRFMREIIYQPDTSIIDLMRDAPSTYTQDDIDVVRTEWGEFVASHVFFT